MRHCHGCNCVIFAIHYISGCIYMCKKSRKFSRKNLENAIDSTCSIRVSEGSSI